MVHETCASRTRASTSLLVVLEEPGFAGPLFLWSPWRSKLLQPLHRQQLLQQVLETSGSRRRTDLLRSLVQKPDVFRPETRDAEVDGWTEWKFGMRNYLGVIDPGFIIDLDEVERHPNRPIDMGTIDAAAGRRSLELCAILQSFVRHRPAKLIRAVTHNNGYEGWRILVTEMQPSTRPRQLALANQLANVKFDPKVSLAVCQVRGGCAGV